MSVITKDIGTEEQLMSVLPDQKYIKSTMTLNRNINKLASDQNSAILDRFPSGQTIQFSIPATDNNLLNLSEMFVSLSGEMRLYKNGARIAETTANAGTYPCDIEIYKVKFGENWIFNCINTVQLKVGKSAVYTVQLPMAYSKWIQSHFMDDRDIKNDNESIYGYPKNDAPIIEPYAFNGSGSPPTFTYTGRNFEMDSDLNKFSINNSSIKWVEGVDGTSAAYLQFRYFLRLSDIFPGVLSMKPVFINDVQLIFQMSSYGSVNATVLTNETGQNKPIFDEVRIEKFTEFNLYAINYQLNTDMIERLKIAFSKPLISVIDEYQYFPNPILSSINDNGLYSFVVPLNLNFMPEVISVCFPLSSANNWSYFSTVDTAFTKNQKTLNFMTHTPNDLRFLNINQITILADGVQIYNKIYKTRTMKTDPAGNYITTLNDIGYYFDSTDKYQEINDFTDAYDLYKTSRIACGSDEEGAMSYKDWLSNAFCIDIPTSAFTKLSSNAQLQISIEFGGKMAGVAVNANPAGLNQRTLRAVDGLLNNIRVIIKSKKALEFTGWNTCTVKPIVQSIENEIVINKTEEEKK